MKMSIPAYKAHQSRLRMENVSVAACRRSSANNRMNAASTRNAQSGKCAIAEQRCADRAVPVIVFEELFAGHVVEHLLDRRAVAADGHIRQEASRHGDRLRGSAKCCMVSKD